MKSNLQGHAVSVKEQQLVITKCDSCFIAKCDKCYYKV